MKKIVVTLLLGACILGGGVTANASEGNETNDFALNWYEDSEEYLKFKEGKEYDLDETQESVKYLKISTNDKLQKNAEKVVVEELPYDQFKLESTFQNAKNKTLLKNSLGNWENSNSPKYLTMRVQVQKWSNSKNFDVTGSYFWNVHPGYNANGFVDNDVVGITATDGLLFNPGSEDAIWENDRYENGMWYPVGGSMKSDIETSGHGLAVNTKMKYHGALVRERGLLMATFKDAGAGFSLANVYLHYRDQIAGGSITPGISFGPGGGSGSLTVNPVKNYLNITPNPIVQVKIK